MSEWQKSCRFFVERSILTDLCFLNNDMETEKNRMTGVFFRRALLGARLISFLSGDKIACIFVLNFN